MDKRFIGDEDCFLFLTWAITSESFKKVDAIAGEVEYG